MKLSTDYKQRGVSGVQRTAEQVNDRGAGDDPTKLVEVISLLKNEQELYIQDTTLA